MVNCSLNGEKINGMDLACSLVVGAATGAAGGAIGMFSHTKKLYEVGFKAICSAGVGICVGLGVYDGGSNSAHNAIAAGVSAFAGTFMDL